VVYNPYIVTPIATWAIAQVIKFAIAAFNGEVEFKNLYASGGMPSVHSAVVSSLAVTSLLIDGAGSHIFGLTVIVAAIVIYDSLGVRRSTGDQAIALNILVAETARGKSSGYKPLREVLGHTPAEVAAGSALGIALGGVFAYDKLGWLSHFVSTVPSKLEYHTYAIAGLVLFLVGILVRLVVPALRKNSRAIRQLAKSVYSIMSVSGFLLMLAALLTYEQASYLAWRLWAVLILVTGGILLLRQAVLWTMRLPEELALEAEHARKSKWFTWGSKRKRAKKS
jgi:acid phosphatase family membrane protein YuiD